LGGISEADLGTQRLQVTHESQLVDYSVVYVILSGRYDPGLRKPARRVQLSGEPRMTMIQISDIQVVGRHRGDLGDLGDLADSLRQIGQLQPIVVTSDLRLVAGGRRLAAAQSLGWLEIEAKIAHDLTDAAVLLRAERDENTCRKSFTPTEEHSLYAALLAIQIAGSGRAPLPSEPSARDKQSVADIVSGSPGRHKTLEKIGEIKRIAADQAHSARLRKAAFDALAEMDRTGNISGPYIKVTLAVRAESALNNADLADWSEDEKSLRKQLAEGHTVVVSFREHHTHLIRWAQAEGRLISVDRRTEWGNPFEMPYDGDRETVIRNYADNYLPYKPSLLSRISELRGKALACWCAPEPCHGDVLKSKAEK
jgi:hypothetical protein